MTRSIVFSATLAAGFVLALATVAQNPPPPSPSAPPPATTHGMYRVTVTFNYDFRLTPACTPTVTKNCVQQFMIYDISSLTTTGIRYKLFPVPLPANPTGLVHIPPFTGPLTDFSYGPHEISVTAIEPGAVTDRNHESTDKACSSCTTWITIPPVPAT